MKNYLLVLLSVLAIGFFASRGISETKSDIVPKSDTQEETILLSEKNSVNKLDLNDLTDSATISYRGKNIKISTTSSNPAGYDYRVTVHKGAFDAVPLSYNDVYKTNKLIYAHNSSNLFGDLSTHGIGSTISVNDNGVTTTYLVKDVRIFKKTSATTLELCHNGYNDCNGDHMRNIANASLIDITNQTRYANYYDVAFMTCTGTSYGNGDASHRLVVYADQI